MFNWIGYCILFVNVVFGVKKYLINLLGLFGCFGVILGGDEILFWFWYLGKILYRWIYFDGIVMILDVYNDDLLVLVGVNELLMFLCLVLCNIIK